MHDCVAPIFCPLIRALYRQVVAYGQEHKRATDIMTVEKSCTMTYLQLHSGSEGRALYMPGMVTCTSHVYHAFAQWRLLLVSIWEKSCGAILTLCTPWVSA